MKITEQKNGSWTLFEKTPNGYYLVKLYKSTGELLDKVLCDNRSNALAYLRSFNAIAKNQGA
jgi:hypothetical protein